MNFKRLIVSAMVAMLPIGLGTSPAAAQQTIKVGAVEPLTGGGSLFGLTGKEGMTLALEDLNAKGGIGGKRFEIVIYDSTTKPPVAATLAQRLIYEDKVPLMIGSASSLDVLAMMEVTEKAKVPMLVPSAASPLITEKGYKWVWRMSLTDKVTARMLGKLIGQRPSWNRVAILYENTDYGRPPSEVVAQLVRQSPGKQLVAMETYNKGDTDVSGQLVKIKGAAPDLLVTWGYYTEAALIARQAQQIGLKVQLMGNQALAFPEYLQLAGPAAEGVMYIESSSSNYNPNPKIQAFVKRYEERFRRLPYNTSVDTYDGVMLLAEVLRRAGSDAQKVQAAINTMTFEGIAEKIKFDPTGQAEKGGILVKVEDRRFKFVDHLQP